MKILYQSYLNTEPPKINFNIENTNEKNQLEPTFDIFVDCKLIKTYNPRMNPINNNCNEINKNICSGFDINSFNLSNISIDNNGNTTVFYDDDLIVMVKKSINKKK